MTEEEQKRKEEARKRQLANLKPIRKFDEMTEEERQKAREIVVKGGKARGEQMKKCKSMKEQALTLLETKLSKDQAKQMIGESAELLADEDLTIQSVLLLSAIREVTENGNSQMAVFLRDTSGQKPKDEISLDASLITTEQDRSLLEKVEKRLSVG